MLGVPLRHQLAPTIVARNKPLRISAHDEGPEGRSLERRIGVAGVGRMDWCALAPRHFPRSPPSRHGANHGRDRSQQVSYGLCIVQRVPSEFSASPILHTHSTNGCFQHILKQKNATLTRQQRPPRWRPAIPPIALRCLPPPLKMPKNKKADPENGSEVCPVPSRPL